MTEIGLYTALQLDLNKLEAPSILLDEFNHFANKAQTQYSNKKYNLFASKQQYTDDLQAFTKTVLIDSEGKLRNRKQEIIGSSAIIGTELGFAIRLPSDYVHILGVVVKAKGCRAKTARRATSDIYGGIQDNAYLKPSSERPYFYISEGLLEIRMGDGIFESMAIDYLAHPRGIELTQEELDSYVATGIDRSDDLGYADYVAYEILRELTALVLEMTSDPRIQSNPVVTNSIN